MRVLFVHQNFPGQFKHLAPALVERGDEVVALCFHDRPVPAGVRAIQSRGRCNTASDGHPWTRDFDSKVIRGEATLRSAIALAEEGFVPDVIVAHPAWGEAMFLKNVWPDVPLALYCEMLYQLDGGDVDFDPEFMKPLHRAVDEANMTIRCLPQSMLWKDAAAGLCPTDYQASTFPEPIRHKISVIHDGIDTRMITPAAVEPMNSSRGHVFRQGDEIITFVNRNLEPLRGYHRLMRALPELQRRRPDAHIVLVGGDGVSYGAKPAQGTWKEHFLAEVRDQLDMSRVHFVGWLSYDLYLRLMRMSRLHIYLTYPFVASWSLAEAMALGVPIVASDTPPVLEFIRDGETGLLVDFFDQEGLIERACRLLEDRALADRLGKTARDMIVRDYDLTTVCLPRQLAWIDSVAAAG